jgi:hypothetical protein
MLLGIKDAIKAKVIKRLSDQLFLSVVFQKQNPLLTPCCLVDFHFNLVPIHITFTQNIQCVAAQGALIESFGEEEQVQYQKYHPRIYL